MNRKEKKQIDDLMSCYSETYIKSLNFSDRYIIFMSDIRNTKIREDLAHDTDIFNEVKTDEQKAYFVNKMNEKMLKRRNDKKLRISDLRTHEMDSSVVIDSDILYHSIDDYFKHGCFFRDKKDELNQERHTNALNQIAKLQNANETDYALELHDFLDKNETEIFNELESYKDESRDIVKDRCSVTLHVPAIVLAQLYKTSRLLDFTKKESEVA